MNTQIKTLTLALLAIWAIIAFPAGLAMSELQSQRRAEMCRLHGLYCPHGAIVIAPNQETRGLQLRYNEELKTTEVNFVKTEMDEAPEGWR